MGRGDFARRGRGEEKVIGSRLKRGQRGILIREEKKLVERKSRLRRKKRKEVRTKARKLIKMDLEERKREGRKREEHDKGNIW